MRSPFATSAMSRALGLALLTAAAGVSAAPLDLYAGPAITDAMKADPRACLNVGDAVSCSAPMLNLLNFQYNGTVLADTAKTAIGSATTGGYIIESPQGGLKQSIVLGSAGAAALDNGETNPSLGKVEDGFKTNSPGNDSFAATGKTGNTAGNLGNPANNALTGTNQDALGTWDVDTSWLVQALTVGGQRREIMIGFDYNQQQPGTESVAYWALITLRDLDSSGNLVKQKNFEIKNDYTTGYGSFSSSKTFDSKPDGGEFGIVNTKTCYKMTGNIVTDVVPTTTGNCPDGTYSTVNNATGTSTTEIIAFLPELNAGLEGFAADGYDTISVRMLFGCFDSGGNSGVGYLSGGSTTQCESGGAVDVYLLAGAPMNQAPEPGSLALVGLALLGAGAGARRRYAAKQAS